MNPPTGTRHWETYQSARVFDDEFVEQLDILPEFVAACGFVAAKAAGYEADDFLAAAVAREERRGGTCIVASGDRDTYQLASRRTTIVQPIRASEMARIGPGEVRARDGVDPVQVPDLHRTAWRFLGPYSGRPRRGPGQRRLTAKALRHAGENSRRRKICRAGSRTCFSISLSPPWTSQRLFPRSAIRSQPGTRPPISRAVGGSIGWRNASMRWRLHDPRGHHF